MPRKSADVKHLELKLLRLNEDCARLAREKQELADKNRTLTTELEQWKGCYALIAILVTALTRPK